MPNLIHQWKISLQTRPQNEKLLMVILWIKIKRKQYLQDYESANETKINSCVHVFTEKLRKTVLGFSFWKYNRCQIILTEIKLVIQMTMQTQAKQIILYHWFGSSNWRSVFNICLYIQKYKYIYIINFTWIQ